MIPLFLQYHHQCSEDITYILRTIAGFGRSREVLIALNEALDSIEQDIVKYDVSDDEDGYLPADERVHSDDFPKRLDLILDCYTIGKQTEPKGKADKRVIPRLTIKKSTATLLGISNALSDLFPMIVGSVTLVSATAILSQMSNLVDTAWKWVSITSDAEGEQRVGLTLSLFHSSFSKSDILGNRRY